MTNRYANNDEEASRRFEKYKSKDPFPEIQPALLNSADIDDYVAATGMIFPFYPEKEKKSIKPASYEVKMLGRCIYWDDEGKKQDKIIEVGDEFPLEKNSIAFVTIEPKLRIPYYLAIRFNLKITHIYRGILLGTGPLVDPGFNGMLSIPLHNLTNNKYILRGGDPLIWMEFTKISLNSCWEGNDQEKIQREGEYVPFPIDKDLSDVNDYLHKAYAGQPIRSSIPEVFQSSKKLSEDAKARLDRYSRIGIMSIIGIPVAFIAIIVALLVPTYQLVKDTTVYIKEVDNRYDKVNNENSKRIEMLEKEVRSLKEMFEKQVHPSPNNAEDSALELDKSIQDVSDVEEEKEYEAKGGKENRLK